MSVIGGGQLAIEDGEGGNAADAAEDIKQTYVGFSFFWHRDVMSTK